MDYYTLITGASGGLGKAFVLECAKRGENLVLTGSNSERLEKVFSDTKKDFPNIKIIEKTCNLAIRAERQAFFGYLLAENIKINKLINNAGFIAEGDFIENSDEKILDVIEVNCAGTVDFTQKTIKQRDENVPLEILTVSSMAGDYPMPHMAIYSATKALLTNLMVSLAVELKGKNVFFTTICPSGIPTTEAMKQAIKAQGFGGKITMCTPENVAKIALKALKKRKVLVHPKFVNKFLEVVSRPLSLKSKAKIVGKRWKKSQSKRNFA